MPPMAISLIERKRTGKEKLQFFCEWNRWKLFLDIQLTNCYHNHIPCKCDSKNKTIAKVKMVQHFKSKEFSEELQNTKTLLSSMLEFMIKILIDFWDFFQKKKFQKFFALLEKLSLTNHIDAIRFQARKRCSDRFLKDVCCCFCSSSSSYIAYLSCSNFLDF